VERDVVSPPLRLCVLAALLTGCLPKTTDLEEQLDREVRALQIRTRSLEAQVASCATEGAASTIYAELIQVYSGTEVQVEREQGRAVVVIPGDVIFTPSSESLREEAAMVLDLLGTALQLHPDLGVWVIGHSDDNLTPAAKKKYGDTMAFSLARARTFADALADRFGVDPKRMTIAGRGDLDPIADNDTPQGRAQNRRLVVVVGTAEKYR
jgi:flagellar motor protein MotB